MGTGIDAAAFERGTDAILRFFTVDQARELIAFRGDEILRTRIDELARKCNEGALSDDEQAEYEGYARANQFIAVLQSKARKLLSSAAH